MSTSGGYPMELPDLAALNHAGGMRGIVQRRPGLYRSGRDGSCRLAPATVPLRRLGKLLGFRQLPHSSARIDYACMRLVVHT